MATKRAAGTKGLKTGDLVVYDDGRRPSFEAIVINIVSNQRAEIQALEDIDDDFNRKTSSIVPRRFMKIIPIYSQISPRVPIKGNPLGTARQEVFPESVLPEEIYVVLYAEEDYTNTADIHEIASFTSKKQAKKFARDKQVIEDYGPEDNITVMTFRLFGPNTSIEEVKQALNIPYKE